MAQIETESDAETMKFARGETETFTETLLNKVAVKGYQKRSQPLNRD